MSPLQKMKQLTPSRLSAVFNQVSAKKSHVIKSQAPSNKMAK